MALSVQEKILVEQRVTNEAKSIVLAYLFWFFVPLGVHRLYLGKVLSGLLMFVAFLVGVVGFFTGAFGAILVAGAASDANSTATDGQLANLAAASAGGLLLFALYSLWWLLDAFLIPGMVSKHKARVRDRLSRELQHDRD